ncbi:MAG: ScpA family protein [Pseudomonadota bacterium]
MDAPAQDLTANVDDLDQTDVFAIDVMGYEGPLHLLLDLARRQKVDLLHVSILELADQYLAFIDNARETRIDLAADYLLMAAWLAFLKSKLLLPKPSKEAPQHTDGDTMAAKLAFRLKRLEAMRRAGEDLMAQPQIGRDVFPRGAPQRPTVVKTSEYDTSLWHLTQAFGGIRQRRDKAAPHAITTQYVLPLEQARTTLRDLTVRLTQWASLSDIRKQILSDDDIPDRSVTASVFSAALELTRDGDVEVRQDAHFAPLYLRGNTRQAQEATQ